MHWWNEVQWLSLLTGLAMKSSVVLGIAWVVAFALRARSAAIRHIVWTAAAAAVLALPFLSGLLPELRVATPQALAQLESGLVFRTATVSPGDAGAAPAVVPGRGTTPGVPARWRPSLAQMAAGIWLAGTIIIVLQMAGAYLAMCRIRRSAREFPDDAMAREAAALMELRRPVRVLQSAPRSMPVTFGIRRPVVFLPADALEWTEESRRMVLLHEFAHIRRGDGGTHILARLALALAWWNPLAWVAWRASLKERERAADDLVLSAGARASAYASRLLEVARSLKAVPSTAWAGIAMARRTQIEGRLLAILDEHVDRKHVGSSAAVAASLVAVLLAAPFAAVRAQTESPAALPEIEATIRAATAQKNPEMLERAAGAYAKLRQYDAAQTLLQSALEIRGQVAGEQSATYAAGLVHLGELALKRGKLPEAQELYAKAVALGDSPEVVPALLFLGRVSYGKRNYEDASALLERAWNADPAGPLAARAVTWLAETKVDAGNAADAESLFQRAIALAPADSADAVPVLNSYARFLRSQDRTDEAVTMESRARDIRKASAARLMPTATSPAVVYKAGDGVAAPRLVSKIEPSYTEEARALKIQGTEVLYVEIAPDGTARNFKVVQGIGYGLDEAGIDAVSQWRFKPGTKDGQAVTVAATIEINWKLM